MFNVALAALIAAQAPASAAPEALPLQSVSAPSSQAEPAPACCRLPALMLVELVLLEEVSSKTAHSGMSVRLALAQPLYVTDSLGLPAGTPVEGLVIHAAAKGMAGKPGELLLGAKRIRLQDGTEVRLRSFKLAPARGKNNETLANVTTATVGLVGLLITGGSAIAQSGAHATAKIAAEAIIPITLLSPLPPYSASAAGAATATPAVPFPATPSTVTQGEVK
jgi:hypothetical protein